MTQSRILFLFAAIGAIAALLGIFDYFKPEPDNIRGYVYYETTAGGALTDDGQLDRLAAGSNLYSEIKVGDLLRTASAKNLRREPDGAPEAIMTTLAGGDCLKVLERIDAEDPPDTTNPGGWLKVETIACPGR